ncbi:glycosyltransferase family 4 protein [Acetobacter fallax]|uniref:glycosyltransferase family 4 protein n=1 Tax=Acetobacter fallax TaxID=1737473 RepID=UPI001F559177|nr:glycosyltransferase family 4 protein [Acetobacter fallax]
MTEHSNGPAVTVLPPRERFAPGEAGAIALLVHRLAEPGEIVVGPPTRRPPFSDVRFVSAGNDGLLTTRWPRGVFWPPFGLRFGPLRYAAAVAGRIASLRPSMIEIHNRPELAIALRAWFPTIPMRLVLHNDPQGMRRVRIPGERETLAQRLAVVCVSDWVSDRYCEGTKLRPSDLFILPNCLDLSALPSPLPVDERQPVILFAGRIVADKGADAFVTACAEVLPELPGWRAEMIGADRFGDDSPETPFLAALRPRALTAGITMTGYQPHEAVMMAMNRAAMMVVPSRWPEPFGLTALEAMACGAALIASPRGALPSLVGDAGILADPDRKSDLAGAIRQMAMDADLREHYRDLGRRRAMMFDVGSARARRRMAPAF